VIPDDSHVGRMAADGVGLSTYPMSFVKLDSSMGVAAGLAFLQHLTGVSYREGLASTGAMSLGGGLTSVHGHPKMMQAAVREGIKVRPSRWSPWLPPPGGDMHAVCVVGRVQKVVIPAQDEPLIPPESIPAGLELVPRTSMQGVLRAVLDHPNGRCIPPWCL
jgi:hypothetical protein